MAVKQGEEQAIDCMIERLKNKKETFGKKIRQKFEDN